jgi:hypothetical protein
MKFNQLHLSNEHYYNLRNQGWVQPGPNGVVDGTPTTPYSGTPPAGSDSGTGGGGSYYNPIMAARTLN